MLWLKQDKLFTILYKTSLYHAVIQIKESHLGSIQYQLLK